MRQNAGLIVDKMLQAAPEGDEADDADEGPEDFVADDEPEAPRPARAHAPSDEVSDAARLPVHRVHAAGRLQSGAS